MSLLRETFDGRLEEVRAYLDFVASVESLTRGGPPRLEGAADPITPQQQRLLNAGVYLHLYSLVEATVTQCLVAVADAAKQNENWLPSDLSDEMLREWVKSMARTQVPMAPDTRLESALAFAGLLLNASPVGEPFAIEKGGGGNWDDESIAKVGQRLGCQIKISRRVYRAVREPVRDELGALRLVKQMRNSLAHGQLSFTESVDEVTVQQLTSIADAVIDYLTEVVEQFEQFIDEGRYLAERHRPTQQAA